MISREQTDDTLKNILTVVHTREIFYVTEIF